MYGESMKSERLVHQGPFGGMAMVTQLPLDENGNKIVRIGHSPDPDDAFMFHAMTTGAFDTPGYNFVHELQDIETLNHSCLLYTSPSPRDS